MTKPLGLAYGIMRKRQQAKIDKSKPKMSGAHIAKGIILKKQNEKHMAVENDKIEEEELLMDDPFELDIIEEEESSPRPPDNDEKLESKEELEELEDPIEVRAKRLKDRVRGIVHKKKIKA